MKHLLYILFSLLVFAACEDDKETVLPYPMNELDGTFWSATMSESSYYDENWILLKQTQYGEDVHMYFKGNSVLDMVPNLFCHEGTYSVSLKDQKFTIGKEHPFDLVEYNKSSFAYSLTFIPFDYECPDAKRRVDTYWFRPAEPEMSWEEFIEFYKLRGKYKNVDE